MNVIHTCVYLNECVRASVRACERAYVRASHLSVVMSRGICVAATRNVMTNSKSMKGSRESHVFRHRPFVAMGDSAVNSVWTLRSARMQAQFV